MAVSLQQIPNFEFSGFYFFDSMRSLLVYKRLNVPEITAEDEEEPFIQLLRAWALAHHYSNTLLDVVANETLLPTARLLESVRSQLKLIDFQLAHNVPATVDLVMQFSSLFTVPTLIVPKNSQFGTESTPENPQIIYEALLDNTVGPTDRLSFVFTNPPTAITLSNKSGNLFDFASAVVPAEGDVLYQNGNYALISDLVDGDTLRLNDAALINNGAAFIFNRAFSADRSGEAFTTGLFFDFGAPDPAPGDMLYCMHANVMWDRIDAKVLQGYRTGIEGVWEFYDGTTDDDNPDDVTNLGGNLRFDVTRLLGAEDRHGTVVRISLTSSGFFEDVVSKFLGGINVVESTGLMGQVAPSTNANDYVVGVAWQPLEVEDGTYDEGAFSKDGAITFALPQDLKRAWRSTTINTKDGFALRFRVQSLTLKAAQFTGTELDLDGLDATHYRIKIRIDGFAATEIDVTGNAGATPGAYTLGGVVTAINTALNGVDPSLANTASAASGQLRFTGPDDDLGKDSEIEFLPPTGQDALKVLTDLSLSGYPHLFLGVGGKAIIDDLHIDEGRQYLLLQAVQGETSKETPLGSSSGSPDQEFTLAHAPLIDGSLVIEVDEGSGFATWERVENFLQSDANARVYTQETDADDVTVVTFGDGDSGKIPQAGVDNIRATYRRGADVDGNVGAQTVTVNRAGISFVDRVFNPRAASGWQAKQGATPESLALLKVQGPASLRAINGAVSVPNIRFLATEFTSPSSGSKPVVRAKVIEETFGIKTIELVVVGTGGNLLSQSQRDELEEHFNGNKSKGIDGIIVANHEVTVVNYTPKVIDVTATVTGGNAEAIKNAIKALLNPEARFDDGVTFRWEFGGEIPPSLITAAIHETDPVSVKKVVLTTPAAPVVLGERELPLAGTLNVTVI